MLGLILRILTAPFRLLARLFRGGGSTARTAGKAGAGTAAKQTAPKDVLGEEFAETPPGGFESLLFKLLPRPRLIERSASDLSLEEARKHLAHADRFYVDPFSLFARGDFFYEEVEEEYLNNALGYGQGSIDERFLKVMALFRRTLNDNTRTLLVVYAPAILTVSLLGGASLARGWGETLAAFTGVGGEDAGVYAALAAAALGGVVAVVILFSWPFMVAQQRNLLNLDNYITSKFARINNNFQVAKRRALNVERNMRMSQAEELKDEAGVWTMTYQWFAMRLLLCEMMIRNRLYQIRRNTTLYWLFGAALSVAATIAVALFAAPAASSEQFAILLAGGGFIVLSYALMQRTTSIMFSVLEANEWSRFFLVNLPKTVRDHVGEDKVQIVTFRDRNRFE